jgi:hypothetical protein
MGLSILGLGTVYSGIKEIFLAMVAKNEINRPTWLKDVPHLDFLGILLLVGIWIWVSYPLISNYPNNLLALVIGLLFSVILLILPRAVAEKQSFE